jgi:hypothetical protein
MVTAQGCTKRLALDRQAVERQVVDRQVMECPAMERPEVDRPATCLDWAKVIQWPRKSSKTQKY